MSNQVKCPRCKKSYSHLTHHHIYPRRWFPNSTETVWLCRRCHDELEEEIRKFEQGLLSTYRSIYEQIVQEFLGA